MHAPRLLVGPEDPFDPPGPEVCFVCNQGDDAEGLGRLMTADGLLWHTDCYARDCWEDGAAEARELAAIYEDWD